MSIGRRRPIGGPRGARRIAAGSPRHGPAGGRARYFRTRRLAERWLVVALSRLAGRVLVAFDFPFGFPAGSGLPGGAALAHMLAARIDDGEDGANNRFRVAADLNCELSGARAPFWGCPPGAEVRHLGPRRPPDTRFAPFRRCDLPHIGRGIQSPWKLYYRGSVGAQALMGLAMVHRLRTHSALVGRVALWPGETDWDRHLDAIVLAETWPSLVPSGARRHAIKDARQVLAAQARAAELDAVGALRTRLARPAALEAANARALARSEAWILAL